MAIPYVLKVRLFSVAILACALAAGCSKAIIRQKPPAPLTQAWGLAVYPVTFLFPVTPYESFTRGRAIADDLSRRTNCLVFGPGEFRVLNTDEDDLRRATTIASVAHYAPERPPQGLFGVRVIVNRLVSTGEATSVTDRAGQSRGTRAADSATDVTVRAELLSMGSRSVVAVVEGHAHADPYADISNGDRFPDVTSLTQELVHTLVSAAGIMPPKQPVDVGLRVVPVLAPALTFVQPGNVSLQAELAKMDALDREAKILTLVKQSAPTAPRSRQRLIQSVASGLIVSSSAGAAARAGLQMDDVIVSANDEPVFGAYSLDRQLRQGAAKLLIKRAGAEREITLSPDQK